MNAIVTVIISGIFTLSGVILGCVLSEVCAARRARPDLCFKLSATPDDELTEVGLRTKTSASEYSITIYNYGQRPFLLERFEFYAQKHLLIDYVLTDNDLTISCSICCHAYMEQGQCVFRQRNYTVRFSYVQLNPKEILKF